MERHLIAPQLGLVTSFEGVQLQADTTFADCPQLDLLFVPGSSNPVSVLEAGHPGSNPYLDFLIQQAPNARLVCSVCTGALLLAGAGLLDGRTVTTHWAFKEVLALFPVNVVPDFRRYVQSGNRVTGGGISSGLDLALYLVSLLYGTDVARRCQLSMQYNPQPIFHCGDPADTQIQDDPAMVADIMTEFHVAEAHKAVLHWLGK